MPPVRIDILTAIEGVEFSDAWADRVQAHFGGVPASVLSVNHLITNKTAAVRDQDLVDVKRLKELQRKST